MPGKSSPLRKADPEAALRAYFRKELEKAEVKLPRLPALPSILPVPYLKGSTVKLDRPGSGLRGNLASLLLAACVLGTAALALSCSPRAALASSICQVVEDQGLETLKQDTIKVAGLVWQQGQEYFRQKHSGIVGATGSPAAEKEKP
jgi:hypothetical protein